MLPNMRVVKLSSDEFPNLESARSFFQSALPVRSPRGKFCVTDARISPKGGLAPGDYLVFTHKSRIVFTARSGSRLLPNRGEFRDTHPWYFVVELDTLREADIGVGEFESKMIRVGLPPKTIGATQGWSRLPGTAQVDELWVWLGTRSRALQPYY